MVIRKNPKTYVPEVPIYLSDEQWLAIAEYFDSQTDGCMYVSKENGHKWVEELKERFESRPAFTTKKINH